MSQNESTNNDIISSKLIPNELYLYFPKKTEIFQQNKYLQSNTKRLIFEGNAQLTPFEATKLSKLNQYIASLQSRTFPISEALRFLYSNSFNLKKAMKAIDNYNKKHSVIYRDNPTQTINDLLNTGFIYLNGRDNRFRPIIHFSIVRFDKVKGQYTINDIVNSVIYIIEYVVRKLLLPGQIESWNLMIDVGNSISDFGFELKQIFNIFKDYYPCRLYKIYLINVKGINCLTWSFVKLYLEKELMTKVFIIKDNERKVYFDDINRSQLEMQYGGLKENIVKTYFPLIDKIDNIKAYLLPFENKESLLISQMEYDLKMKTDSLLYQLPTNYHIENSTNIQIHTINEAQVNSINDLFDKHITSTPNITIDNEEDNPNDITNNIHITTYSHKDTKGILRNNSNCNSNNLKVLSPTNTKTDDITIDSHVTNCTYFCRSANGESGCVIY